MEKFQVARSSPGLSAPFSEVVPGSYLVTGANGKLGSEITNFLSQQPGVRVIATGRSAERMEASRLHESPNTECVVLDFSDQEKLIELLLAKGRIKGIVHCEGTYGEIGDLATLDINNWMDTFADITSRVISLIQVSKALAERQGHISLVFLSGGGATEAYAALSNYTVMKTALVRIIETASIEIDSSLMSLNALGPGATDSPMVDQILSSKIQLDSRIVNSSKQLRLEKKGVSPRVFSSLSFLLSTQGRYLSGNFYSADWDDWESVKNSGTPNFRLRRLIPPE